MEIESINRDKVIDDILGENTWGYSDDDSIRTSLTYSKIKYLFSGFPFYNITANTDISVTFVVKNNKFHCIYEIDDEANSEGCRDIIISLQNKNALTIYNYIEYSKSHPEM